jgi:CheY-like chemotaxis protein/anti-sigma regulatory factor (Ser/Thr protein kinase)
VFSNLLTNAAKYTEVGGHIRIIVAVSDGQITVTIEDDGTGIAPDLLPQIFDIFVQGYRSVDRSAGGLGIGLTLVRKLTEMHGGTVSAHSEGAGTGSTFTVTLPHVPFTGASPSEMRATVKMPKVAKPRRILLVDDNEDALALLSEALEAAGHTVRTAKDPAEALQVINEFNPELAILDIGLPVMDGYELAQKIREKLEPKTPRLFALSGYGQHSDREKSLEAGFADHFVKPVDVKQLIERIAAS